MQVIFKTYVTDYSSLLKEDKWSIIPSDYYFDEDEEKWREIDIRAIKETWSGSQSKSIDPYYLSLTLIIECQRSEAAWVFFPQPREIMSETGLEYTDFLTVVKIQSLIKEKLSHNHIQPPTKIIYQNIEPNLFYKDSIVAPDIAQKLWSISNLQVFTQGTFRNLAKDNVARAYKEIKIKKVGRKEPPNDIYDAVNKVIKATKRELIHESESAYDFTLIAKAQVKEKTKQQTQQSVIRYITPQHLYIGICIPILVLDGNLYSWINGDVKEETDILLEGKCRTKNYYDNMLISVVKKEYFNEFLKNINDDFTKLADIIYDKKAEIDAQTELLMTSPWQ